MFVGPATLELAGTVIEVQVTLHLRVGADQLAVWDGYFTTSNPAGADALLEAQAGATELVALRLAGSQDTSSVLITSVAGDHGALRGSGDPPARLRR
jgi:hypothetical protein